MSIEGDMRERHGRVLAELAETGMVMVRRLSEAMLATDDVQVQAQVGLAFHRVSRAVRQTLALELRLDQEARRDARDIPAPARPAPRTEAAPAQAPPRVQPERTGWDEYESDDSDELLDELDALLESEEPDLEAVRQTIEASMARIRRDIAANPLLMKAGVLEAAPAPAPARTALPLTGPKAPSRRSQLMGAGAFAGLPGAATSPVTMRAGWRSSG